MTDNSNVTEAYKLLGYDTTLLEGEHTLEDLHKSESFRRASEQLYFLKEGSKAPPLADGAAYIAYGINKMRWSQNNLFAGGNNLYHLIAKADDAQKVAMLYMMNAYSNSNSTWTGWGLAALQGIVDPTLAGSVVAGALSGGTGAAAGLAARTAALKGVTTALEKGAERIASNAAVKYVGAKLAEKTVTGAMARGILPGILNSAAQGLVDQGGAFTEIRINGQSYTNRFSNWQYLFSLGTGAGAGAGLGAGGHALAKLSEKLGLTDALRNRFSREVSAAPVVDTAVRIPRSEIRQTVAGNFLASMVGEADDAAAVAKHVASDHAKLFAQASRILRQDEADAQIFARIRLMEVTDGPTTRENILERHLKATTELLETIKDQPNRRAARATATAALPTTMPTAATPTPAAAATAVVTPPPIPTVVAGSVTPPPIPTVVAASVVTPPPIPTAAFVSAVTPSGTVSLLADTVDIARRMAKLDLGSGKAEDQLFHAAQLVDEAARRSITPDQMYNLVSKEAGALRTGEGKSGLDGLLHDRWNALERLKAETLAAPAPVKTTVSSVVDTPAPEKVTAPKKAADADTAIPKKDAADATAKKPKADDATDAADDAIDENFEQISKTRTLAQGSVGKSGIDLPAFETALDPIKVFLRRKGTTFFPSSNKKTGQWSVFWTDLSKTPVAMRMESRPVTGPVFDAVAKFLEEKGLTQAIKDLQEAVLANKRLGDRGKSTDDLIAEFVKKNRKSFGEFAEGMRELKEHVRIKTPKEIEAGAKNEFQIVPGMPKSKWAQMFYTVWPREYGRYGLTEPQHAALLKHIDMFEKMAIDLTKTDGVNASQIRASVKRHWDPKAGDFVDGMDTSPVGLSSAYQTAHTLHAIHTGYAFTPGKAINHVDDATQKVAIEWRTAFGQMVNRGVASDAHSGIIVPRQMLLGSNNLEREYQNKIINGEYDWRTEPQVREFFDNFEQLVNSGFLHKAIDYFDEKLALSQTPDKGLVKNVPVLSAIRKHIAEHKSLKEGTDDYRPDLAYFYKTVEKLREDDDRYSAGGASGMWDRFLVNRISRARWMEESFPHRLASDWAGLQEVSLSKLAFGVATPYRDWAWTHIKFHTIQKPIAYVKGIKEVELTENRRDGRLMSDVKYFAHGRDAKGEALTADKAVVSQSFRGATRVGSGFTISDWYWRPQGKLAYLPIGIPKPSTLGYVAAGGLLVAQLGAATQNPTMESTGDTAFGVAMAPATRLTPGTIGAVLGGVYGAGKGLVMGSDVALPAKETEAISTTIFRHSVIGVPEQIAVQATKGFAAGWTLGANSADEAAAAEADANKEAGAETEVARDETTPPPPATTGGGNRFTQMFQEGAGVGTVQMTAPTSPGVTGTASAGGGNRFAQMFQQGAMPMITDTVPVVPTTTTLDTSADLSALTAAPSSVGNNRFAAMFKQGAMPVLIPTIVGAGDASTDNNKLKPTVP